MDASLALISAALLEGLLQVGGKLVDAGVDASLEPGKELLKKWIQKKYQAKETDLKLSNAIQDAIKQVNGSLQEENLATWLKEMGLLKLQLDGNQSLRRTVARAILGFTDPSSKPPQSIIVSLGWPRSRVSELSKLLFAIRMNLAGLDEYKDLVAYADRVSERDALKRILEQLERTDRVVVQADGGDSLRVIISNQTLTRDEAAIIEQNYRDELVHSLKLHDFRGISQVCRGVRIPLSELYVDLGLVPIRDAQQINSLNELKLVSTVQERVSSEIFSSHNRVTNSLNKNRIVLLGEPGGGKTTSLRFIALMLAYGYATPRLALEYPFVPLLIRLTDFAYELIQNPAFSLVHYIKRHAEQTFPNIPRLSEFLYYALEQGVCMILLDGLDEVGSSTANPIHAEVVQKVQQFSDRWCQEKDNHIVVTSRLEGYWSSPLLSFDHYQLAPLQYPGDVKNFLEKWYVGYEQCLDTEVETNEAQNRALEKAEKLISLVSKSINLIDLSANPLLLTILVVAYESIGILPNKRIKLYQIVSQTLIESWRQTQKGVSDQILVDLGEDAIIRIMSELAFWLHENKPGGIAHKREWQSVLISVFAQGDFESTSQKLAEKFLEYMHYQVGVIVERGPEHFGFFHLTFEEYLAARYIARQRENERKRILKKYWEDPAWSEIIALTVGQLGIVEGRTDDASDLIEDLLKMESVVPSNSGKAAILAGRALIDLGLGNVNAHTRRWVQDELKAVMQDLDLETHIPNEAQTIDIRTRVTASEVLDETGWVPYELYKLIHTYGPDQIAKVWIGQFPVTNIQYQRFLTSPDFDNPSFWSEKYLVFDKDGLLVEVEFDVQTWIKKFRKYSLRPKYWDNYNLGSSKKCFPVVGVSWFEASAYCRWLQHNWDCLEEKDINSSLTPDTIRLPSREEWLTAAGSKNNSNRFPWNKPNEITDDVNEMLRRLNVYESGIGKTTSVCLYPLGRSNPYELWDMAGNVFEWSASLSDESQETFHINGGSFYYDHEFALCSSRFWYPPDGVGPYLGFRVVLVAK